MIVPARQSDTLDLICWRELGTTESGVVEQALELNPGLAAGGPIIAEGTSIVLPEPAATTVATRETVNLWE